MNCEISRSIMIEIDGYRSISRHGEGCVNDFRAGTLASTEQCGKDAGCYCSIYQSSIPNHVFTPSTGLYRSLCSPWSILGNAICWQIAKRSW